MSVASVRELYEETWQELFELVARRNRLLRTIEMMAALAKDTTPAAGMVIEFDVTRAEELLAGIDGLNPRISAAIQQLNIYAEKCGRPTVKWQHVLFNSGD